MTNSVVVVGSLLTLVVLILATPFALLLGLNLLGFAVPYTLKTWCGALLVRFALRGSTRYRQSTAAK
jgi:hypothetical protein